MPDALNAALTLMEAKALVGKLAAQARFDPKRSTTDERRASVVAELAKIGGMFEALGTACRVNFTHG